MTIDQYAPEDLDALEGTVFERTPPHDIAAEMSVLGSCMLSPIARTLVLEILGADAFYKPAHATIFTAIAEMHGAQQPVDPITLSKYLADRGDSTRTGGWQYLTQLVQAVPTWANADHHADIVQDRYLRRALIELGTSLVQMGYSSDDATADLVERAVTLTRDLRDRGMAAEDLPTEDILDFVQHEDTYDWLVPGLLERHDRLILTASEGGGKSTLLRQMAVAMAAGVHPFKTWDTINPVKVLTLDCENGAAASRRKFRPLLEAAARIEQPVTRGQFHIECRPEGLDLTRPQDRAWMMRRVEKLDPDILIIGPVYRLHAGNPNDEELARKVSVVIDEARSTAHCAVLMEAHAPHGNNMGPRSLRPLGSSLWMRWPEFGFGLRPVEDEKSAQNTEGARGRRVVPWRGMRDERDWPQFIKQGEHWPWTSYKPIDADEYTGYSPTGAIW
ncbi:DnaB-like helicase N-terminal domain-containing protein [Streptomyces sp. ME02-7008A-1]|uniref:DnaB-like helicase N-terminal domain-containing protein n=1 Tax=unclassified Streptomyces TaxID=2593676 RepID=UPI0029A49486|nr:MULTISPECIES: DnaB-like helicase N-terminal domain-containing protein [unclassified Streptomyces]MDX3183551.1 DnaB-like helicase N-terminal domain-containing protein [Streptomyces sp. ME02-7008A-1]MDX3304003.1 DnaB-like helicase N-terminal domain-containing protein [Streptomyces sp. ME02-7008A]